MGEVSRHTGLLAVTKEAVAVDVIVDSKDALFHNVLSSCTLGWNKGYLSACTAPVNGALHFTRGVRSRGAAFLKVMIKKRKQVSSDLPSVGNSLRGWEISPVFNHVLIRKKNFVSLASYHDIPSIQLFEVMNRE